MESGQETANAGTDAAPPTNQAHLHPPSGVTTGHVTPLYRARHEPRFRRQHLIKAYQNNHDCNLVVVIDQIVPDTITHFAETLMELDPTKDLHLLLHTPGGDGEVAVRMARMAQEASARFVLLVPDTAKSAGTVLALAAHEIVMAATSDLGPIDPQIFVADRGFVSAKDLIVAVDGAIAAVNAQPDTFAIQAAMLAGIDATTLQFARSALARTGDLARQAISSHSDRTPADIDALCKTIAQPFIESPRSHHAVIGAHEAEAAGLPITRLPMQSPHWLEIWEIWSHYFALGPLATLSVYEGARASLILSNDA
ncbi:ATP-dependent Clp protease proteolytic subunit [Amycolatopsis sp. NPDC051102]|uniref:SDH family Clp fold serine proteinase n=1 Tax=Amycolatopsis sp. NPDC051102 TaxID=3155163 RepID=UPI0034271FE7